MILLILLRLLQFASTDQVAPVTVQISDLSLKIATIESKKAELELDHVELGVEIAKMEQICKVCTVNEGFIEMLFVALNKARDEDILIPETLQKLEYKVRTIIEFNDFNYIDFLDMDDYMFAEQAKIAESIAKTYKKEYHRLYNKIAIKETEMTNIKSRIGKCQRALKALDSKLRRLTNK
ncbi:hypothetical protein ECANGB1_1602 [Enterospora canceri]|uniref:Uncharacterized protein n=1 Tax=Enterospora canceri TaxID=1081671 RepID=A0A1Y1S6F8_9MICR|nr:hypothetical protein ECANGB1_1602 [Enterospora canceri]